MQLKRQSTTRQNMNTRTSNNSWIKNIFKTRLQLFFIAILTISIAPWFVSQRSPRPCYQAAGGCAYRPRPAELVAWLWQHPAHWVHPPARRGKSCHEFTGWSLLGWMTVLRKSMVAMISIYTDRLLVTMFCVCKYMQICICCKHMICMKIVDNIHMGWYTH